MGNVIKGPWRALGEADAPADVQAVIDKYAGISMSPSGMVNGTDVVLPTGQRVCGNGYTRTTGQWRENMDILNGYEVELVCLKTMKHGWVKAEQLEGFFKIEELYDGNRIA